MASLHERPAFWKNYNGNSAVTEPVCFRKKGLLKKRPSSYHGHRNGKHGKRVHFVDEVSRLLIIINYNKSRLHNYVCYQ